MLDLGVLNKHMPNIAKHTDSTLRFRVLYSLTVAVFEVVILLLPRDPSTFSEGTWTLLAPTPVPPSEKVLGSPGTELCMFACQPSGWIHMKGWAMRPRVTSSRQSQSGCGASRRGRGQSKDSRGVVSTVEGIFEDQLGWTASTEGQDEYCPGVYFQLRQ